MAPLTVRRATVADSADLLAWRNDAVTREMSRSSEAVDQAAHDRWLASALQNSTLLIGEADGVKVGMARIDRGDAIEVSINLNPDCRGRGLSLPLLSAALADEAGVVLAVVKVQNLASRRLFERAGFKQVAQSDGLIRYERPAS